MSDAKDTTGGKDTKDTTGATGQAAQQLVRVAQQGPAAVLTIDRPPVNALSRALLDVLGQALDAVEHGARQGAIRALVITSAGEKAFVAGADISEMAHYTPVQAGEMARKGQTLLRRLEMLPVPVIAAVNGYCLGGGSELAMACDFRIAAAGARFGQPEVNLGIIPGFGGTQRLVRLIGRARALDMCARGETITADDALRLGLVNAVVPDGKALEEAVSLAARLALKATAAIGLIKRAIYDGADLRLDDAMELEARLFADSFRTEDHAEGLKAFLEKRAPVFTGR